MITSIFSKSKPINYVIVLVLIIVAFAFYIYTQVNTADFLIWQNLAALSIVLFYVFIVDFIISKNDITKNNSYGILVLGLSFFIFPEVFSNTNLLVSNLLILFALRRLFSLHTKRDLKKKFFDAVFWISLASLFYSWAILYFVVVILALAYYWQNEGKYLAISIFGTASAFVLLVLYNIIFKDQYLPLSNFDFSFSFDYSKYNTTNNIVRFTIVITTFVWSLFFYIKNASDKKLKPIRVLIILSCVIALVIAFLAPQKLGNEVVFFTLPFAIVVANYIEIIEETWFKELFIGLLILVSIINLLL